MKWSEYEEKFEGKEDLYGEFYAKLDLPDIVRKALRSRKTRGKRLLLVAVELALKYRIPLDELKYYVRRDREGYHVDYRIEEFITSRIEAVEFVRRVAQDPSALAVARWVEVSKEGEKLVFKYRGEPLGEVELARLEELARGGDIRPYVEALLAKWFADRGIEYADGLLFEKRCPPRLLEPEEAVVDTLEKAAKYGTAIFQHLLSCIGWKPKKVRIVGNTYVVIDLTAKDGKPVYVASYGEYRGEGAAEEEAVKALARTMVENGATGMVAAELARRYLPREVAEAVEIFTTLRTPYVYSEELWISQDRRIAVMRDLSALNNPELIPARVVKRGEYVEASADGAAGRFPPAVLKLRGMRYLTRWGALVVRTGRWYVAVAPLVE